MANSKQISSPQGQAYNFRFKVGDDDYVVFMGTTNSPIISLLSRCSEFMNRFFSDADKSYTIDAVNYEQLKNLNHEQKA